MEEKLFEGEYLRLRGLIRDFDSHFDVTKTWKSGICFYVINSKPFRYVQG